VYEYGGSCSDNWFQLGDDIDGEANGDGSGHSVSLSADGTIVVAIGAIFNDDNGDDSGHVRVFEHVVSSSGWVQLGDDIDGEAADDYSGLSVSLSKDGKTVAIGATRNDGNASDSVHAREYEYTPGLQMLESACDSERYSILLCHCRSCGR
jgi:hypothetical protein